MGPDPRRRQARGPRSSPPAASCVAGRSLKATPAGHAGALFHLGTFLVPIDVAAIGMRAELDWATMLLAQGLVATAHVRVGAQHRASVVLRWAFAVSVVALAGGIGATTALPAPLVLAGVRRRGAARCAATRLAPAGPALAGVARCSPSSTS